LQEGNKTLPRNAVATRETTHHHNIEKHSLLSLPTLLCLTGSANAEVANQEEQTQYQEQAKESEVDEAVEQNEEVKLLSSSMEAYDRGRLLNSYKMCIHL
jgi:hypothetical protein